MRIVTSLVVLSGLIVSGGVDPQASRASAKLVLLHELEADNH